MVLRNEDASVRLFRAVAVRRAMVGLSIALCAGGAAAQTVGGMPVYVSDRFQQVAEKVVLQVALEEISKACKPDQPLCHAMLQDLLDAAKAGFAKDRVKMKSVLSDFFVSSSSAGLMDATIGDLIGPGSPVPELTSVLRPVATCLSGIVTGHKQDDACKLKPEVASSLVGEGAKTLCAKIDPGQAPLCVSSLEALQRAVTAPVFRAGDVARAAAPIAELGPSPRPDITIYLQSLGRYLDQRPELGVFDAIVAFLTQSRPLDLEAALMTEDYGRYVLMHGPRNVFEASEMEGCDLSSTDEAWRDPAEVARGFRRALILGHPPDMKPLDDVAKLPGCAKEPGNGHVAQLRQFARTIEGQLRVGDAIRRFAVPGLLAASVIDLARSGNKVELDRQLRETVRFALAQLVAHASMVRLDAQGGSISASEVLGPKEILGSCEFQTMMVMEQRPLTVQDPANPTCTALDGTRTSLGKVATKLAPEAPVTMVDALDLFASVVQANRPGPTAAGANDDYMHLLGALLTAQRATFKKAVEAPIARLTTSPIDAQARAAIQTAAAQFSASGAIPAADLASAPMVDERQFAQLLTMSDTARTALLNKVAGLTKSQLRLKKLLGNPALKTTNTILPIPNRVIIEAPATREARVTAFFTAARGILDAIDPNVQASAKQAGIDVDLLVKGIEAAAGEREAVARKLLLQGATAFLIAQVGHYTEKMVGAGAQQCIGEPTNGAWIWITDKLGRACAAKVLIDGAYKPIAEFIWADDLTFTADSAAALADKGYRSLIASPVLQHTMLIFNVGLGATVVSGKRGAEAAAHPEEEGFVALTLLDKLGIAVTKYRSPRNEFEAGFFVGGFLDALARTAVDNKDKFWLGGVTCGWTKMWGVDLGLQFHVGGAFPFTFNTEPRFAVGASLAVPFTYVFD